jgi:hypothetical protein
VYSLSATRTIAEPGTRCCAKTTTVTASKARTSSVETLDEAMSYPPYRIRLRHRRGKKIAIPWSGYDFHVKSGTPGYRSGWGGRGRHGMIAAWTSAPTTAHDD